MLCKPLEAKLIEFSKERKRLVSELNKLDEDIRVLKRALQLLDYEVKPTRESVFFTKPKIHLVTIFKANPTFSFSTEELTEKVMKIDGIADEMSEKYVDSIRKVLNHLSRQNWVIKQKQGKQTFWRWH